LAVLCWLFSLLTAYVGNVLDRFTVSFVTSFYALLFPWLVLFLVEQPASFLHRFLAWKPWAFVARLSYGMYISHFLGWSVLIGPGRGGLMAISGYTGIPIWLVAFGITVGRTMLISWVLDVVVESPLLGLKRHVPYAPAIENPSSPARSRVAGGS
jgi:peptidoglycan/LPS O-acetylase OafA/YrhL